MIKHFLVFLMAGLIVEKLFVLFSVCNTVGDFKVFTFCSFFSIAI